jgi:Protein of unknown function (DUF2490)
MAQGALGRMRATVITTVLSVMVVRALAAQTNTEFAPQAWAFVDLSDRARLFFLANLTDNFTQETRGGTIGAHFDLALKPILRRGPRVADWARKKYLWVRVGYRQGFGTSARETGVLQVTSRFPLPLGIWMETRLRTDVRNETGGFSARQRFRSHFEREIGLGRLTVTPYVRAEALYDSLPNTWGWRYQAGAELALSRHWRVEPYYMRRQNQRSADVNRIGFIVKTYW